MQHFSHEHFSPLTFASQPNQCRLFDRYDYWMMLSRVAEIKRELLIRSTPKNQLKWDVSVSRGLRHEVWPDHLGSLLDGRFSPNSFKWKSELANTWRVGRSVELTVGASSETVGVLQQACFYSYFRAYLGYFELPTAKFSFGRSPWTGLQFPLYDKIWAGWAWFFRSKLTYMRLSANLEK